MPTRFDADKDTVDDGDERDVKDAATNAVVAADNDAIVVTSAVFDDAGEFETVPKAENDAKADDDALTVFVAPVTVARTELDADSEGFDAVAIPVTADESEGDKDPDIVGFEVIEPDCTLDFEESSVGTGDCVGRIVVETLKVIPPIETVGSAVKESEATFDSDERPEVEGSTVTDDTTVPLTDALEKGVREFAGDAELSTVNVLTIVTVRDDKMETLTSEEIENAFDGLTLDVDTEDPLLD